MYSCLAPWQQKNGRVPFHPIIYWLHITPILCCLWSWIFSYIFYDCLSACECYINIPNSSAVSPLRLVLPGAVPLLLEGLCWSSAHRRLESGWVKEAPGEKRSKPKPINCSGTGVYCTVPLDTSGWKKSVPHYAIPSTGYYWWSFPKNGHDWGPWFPPWIPSGKGPWR